MPLKSHFASPERASAPELQVEIDGITNNPLIDTLMCTSSSLFAVLNRHRQILTLNQSFLDVMGIHDPEKALGLRPGEYLHCVHASEMPAGCGTSIHCSECGAVLAILAALESDDTHEQVCELKATRDNTQVDMTFQVKCCRTTIDNEIFILLFLQDISPLLQQAYEELHAIIETANDGFLVLDTAGTILDANGSFCRLAGYEKTEILRRPISTFCGTGEPGELQRHFDGIVQCVPRVFEARVTRKDGGTSYVEVSCTVIPAHAERIYCFCRDITQRKQAEEQLHEQAVLLEAEIAERQKAQESLAAVNATLEADIATAVAELRQKDELLINQNRLAAMGKLLSAISHHWRQPLNNIASQLQAVQYLNDSNSLTSEELKRDIDQVTSMVWELSETIDDFRYLFKSDHQICEFLVQDVIERCLHLIKPSLADEHIQVVVQGGDQLPVTGSPHKYAQCLVSLLDNARDAFKQSQVPDRCILISIAREAGRSMVTVQDNAGGISEGLLPHIFEPYFSTKGPKAGTGIGLYMAKSLIEYQMGGQLTASNIDKGAAFTIVL